MSAQAVEASRIRTQHVCRRCRVEITPSNTRLLMDERALGMTLADVEACNRCRPTLDEEYGLACFHATARVVSSTALSVPNA